MALADLFSRHARRRVMTRFNELFDNEDAATYRVARQALNGELSWLEQGIIGVDAYLGQLEQHSFTSATEPLGRDARVPISGN
jgi:hypothetical protein